MNFAALEQNLCDNISEAQQKLSGSPMPISLNYMLPTLRHLLETDASAPEMRDILAEFAVYAAPRLGTLELRPIDGGFCIRVPKEGAEWVHENIEPSAFLAALLAALRDPDVTTDRVFAVFRQFSADAVIEESRDEEFDYLAFFPDGVPDAYRYCIRAEEEPDGSMHISYHRFTAADYADFGI